GGCSDGAPHFDYKDIPVEITLPLIGETTPPRDGYTKVDVDNALVNVDVTKDDVAVCKGCGVAQVICDGVFRLINDIAFRSLIGGVKDQLRGALRSAVCHSPSPTAVPACPSGSHDDSGTCVFDSDTARCVPTPLGTDGHLDLSGMLEAFSPGTAGGLDFGLA